MTDERDGLIVEGSAHRPAHDLFEAWREAGVPLVLVECDDLEPNPWNPNQMDDHILDAERESIRTYGFVDPVTVRRLDEGGFQIVDGEHRWRVAVEEGFDRIPVVALDVDETTAKRLTVVLNETRGEADPVKLADVLADLRAEVDTDEELAKGLPYRRDELRSLLAIADDDFGPKGSDGGGPRKTEWWALTLHLPIESRPAFEKIRDHLARADELDQNERVGNGQVAVAAVRYYIENR